MYCTSMWMKMCPLVHGYLGWMWSILMTGDSAVVPHLVIQLKPVLVKTTFVSLICGSNEQFNNAQIASGRPRQVMCVLPRLIGVAVESANLLRGWRRSIVDAVKVRMHCGVLQKAESMKNIKVSSSIFPTQQGVHNWELVWCFISYLDTRMFSVTGIWPNFRKGQTH